MACFTWVGAVPPIWLRLATEPSNVSAMITDDVYQVLTLEGSVASRNHIGGTAPTQVKQAIARARRFLN